MSKSQSGHSEKDSRELTLRQRLVLDYLVKTCGIEPKTITHKTLGPTLGMSEKAARVHLDALEKKGFIYSAVACLEGSAKPVGRRIRVLKAGDKKIEAKDYFGEELLLYGLSEDEFRYMRAIARQEMKDRIGEIYEQSKEPMIVVHIQNNLLRFIEVIKFRRYIQSSLAYWSPDFGNVPYWYKNGDKISHDEFNYNTRKYQSKLYKHPEKIDTWYKLAAAYTKMGMIDKVNELYSHLRHHDDQKMAYDFYNKCREDFHMTPVSFLPSDSGSSTQFGN